MVPALVGSNFSVMCGVARANKGPPLPKRGYGPCSVVLARFSASMFSRLPTAATAC